ncbi:uncharacterized protein PHACADRAFT_210624 [Phanerochaete carnosa HHB-10118-sp]|uniref:Uncharacterized protein n=1 Tax=Phanerochaete carnosa (strain HHB-10118-sp) TaxID=650164 RepID=K5VTN9_PHACS|nr:uncharacterized protein PHACADRAFT_210624 [Phanerochaete carnosa HHB-10118-sp]EKM54848.1 hypothetical protein PHACADRAFT_210624 [Phanerochaete carnosa HHB-10118-sp]
MYDIMDTTERLTGGLAKCLTGGKTTVALHPEGKDGESVYELVLQRPWARYDIFTKMGKKLDFVPGETLYTEEANEFLHELCQKAQRSCAAWCQVQRTPGQYTPIGEFTELCISSASIAWSFTPRRRVGRGVGIGRLAFLTDSANIREVLRFPTRKPGIETATNTAGPVEHSRQDHLSLLAHAEQPGGGKFLQPKGTRFSSREHPGLPRRYSLSIRAAAPFLRDPRHHAHQRAGGRISLSLSLFLPLPKPRLLGTMNDEATLRTLFPSRTAMTAFSLLEWLDPNGFAWNKRHNRTLKSGGCV